MFQRHNEPIIRFTLQKKGKQAMKERLYVWGVLLVLGLLILSGCTVSQAQDVADMPPVAETPEPTPVNVPNPAFARDTALTYVRENYQPDLKEMTWTESNLTQEGLVGGSTFRYSAMDWIVEVSFPVVNPADTIYKVTVANEGTDFSWQGEVDATGQVSELRDETSEWFDPIRARDAALAYLCERYGERAPRLDLVWDESDTTPGAPEKPLPGANELQYVSGNWTITLSYPVVRPDIVEYQIAVVNEPAGFRWEGKVTASGEVIDALEPVPVQVPDPAMARDAAMTYLGDHYRGLAPMPMPAWHEQNVTDEGLVGHSTVQYRGKDWLVTVSFPLVNPAVTVYQVTIANEAHGFEWQGEVDATGQTTERALSGDIASLLVDEDEWQPYYSKKFGYAFSFPGDCAVVSKNLDEALQVSTATTTGEGWPCLQVTHYDSDFYHPPAGTDLQQWIVDWEIHHDEMDTDVEIAGLPTVHLITKAAKGAYAYDEYYFSKGEQLFRILIVHCGKQDWDLYDRFLSGFIFPGA